MDFTRFDSPDEIPENPTHLIDTCRCSTKECVEQLLDYVEAHLVDPVSEFVLR